MRPRARSCSRSGGTPATSLAWPSAPMASGSSAAAGTRLLRCGTFRRTSDLAGQNFEKEQFTWRIGDNKCVGNVFVWLRPEAGELFELSDKQVEELGHSLSLRTR